MFLSKTFINYTFYHIETREYNKILLRELL